MRTFFQEHIIVEIYFALYSKLTYDALRKVNIFSRSKESIESIGIFA